MKMNWRVAAALVAAGVIGNAGSARAQAVTFTGYTFGCFYSGAVVPSCSLPSDIFAGLSYQSANFNVTSNAADGFLSIGALAPANFNNLGSFTLTGGGVDYTGEHFALVINFTAPPGSTAGTYSAVLKGNLVGSSSGNVGIDFDNSDQLFLFSDGTKLTFGVNDVSVNDGPGSLPIVAITGQGTVVSPEPASLTLLATGLVGIFGAARRRKNAAA